MKRTHTQHGIVHGLAVESVVVHSDPARSYVIHGNSHYTVADARALLAALGAAVQEASLAPSLAAGAGMPGGEK